MLDAVVVSLYTRVEVQYKGPSLLVLLCTSTVVVLGFEFESIRLVRLLDHYASRGAKESIISLLLYP